MTTSDHLLRCCFVAAMLLLNLHQSSASPDDVDATTLEGKTIAGYQGWFSCPDDKTGMRNWGHWQRGDGKAAVDMLPDTSEWPQQPGCLAPFLKDAHDQPAHLYSSQDPAVVDRQVKWLKDYSVSGLAVQTFLSTLKDPKRKEGRDVVLRNVARASAKYGRTYMITYDVNGAGEDWAHTVEQDWEEVVGGGFTRDGRYLHHLGKPVVEIWGAGYNRGRVDVQSVMDLLRYFSAGPTDTRASVMLGVPMTWRSETSHKDGEASWLDVFSRVASISPWVVGAYSSPSQASGLIKQWAAGDIGFCEAHHIVYVPVIFPGFSDANSSGRDEKFERAPRQCGALFRSEISSLLSLKAKSFYIAMFDEANEGTAIFKTGDQGDHVRRSNLLNFGGPACPGESDLYLRELRKLNGNLHPFQR